MTAPDDKCPLCARSGHSYFNIENLAALLMKTGDLRPTCNATSLPGSALKLTKANVAWVLARLRATGQNV